jgi:transposase
MAKRHFSPEEKYRILEEGRQPGGSIAEVCRRYQVSSSLFYKWEAEARRGALAALAGKKGKGKADNEKQHLQEKISRLRAVISEITEENLGLKKTLGE